jgi:hypothetical protein
LCGEHLSLENINTAIQHVCEQEKIEIPEFCLFAESEEQRHSWFIGTADEVESNRLLAMIDQELCKLNDDYAAVRKYSLKEPILRILPVKTFYEFMEHIGKAGSQNKVPRVMNAKQSENWQAFLKKKGLI